MNELDGKLNITTGNISKDGNYNSIVKTPKKEINQKQFQNNYNNQIINNSIHQTKELNNNLINQNNNIDEGPKITEEQLAKLKIQRRKRMEKERK